MQLKLLEEKIFRCLLNLRRNKFAFISQWRIVVSMNKYITIVELTEFKAFAKKHLSDDEVSLIISDLAKNPKAGDLIAGSGGLRKFRFARTGKGKSGGCRIIHYYHDNDIPVFLITGFAKNEMENISKSACNTYQKILPLIVANYKVNNHRKEYR